MDFPSRNASYVSTIKCTNCAVELDMLAMVDHVCPTSPNDESTSNTTDLPSISESQPIYLPKRGASLYKPNRPVLPKIDPTAPPGRMLNPAEAASIAHDLGLPSPVSAGGPRKSARRPRGPSRKTSAQSHHRQPSSDVVISQDCAFPAFPTKKPAKRSQTDKEKPRSESRSTSRSVSRTRLRENSIAQSTISSVPSLYNSTSSGYTKRRTSTTSSNQRSRTGTIDEIPSHPSTAPSSPRQHAVIVESRDSSLDFPSPFPPLESSMSNQDHFTEEPESLTSWPLSGADLRPKENRTFDVPENNDHSPAPLPREPSPEPEVYEDVLSLEHTNESVTFDNILQSEPSYSNHLTSDVAAKEPSYKAKRPPPIARPEPYNEDDVTPLSTRSPTVPLTASSLTKTLTGFFTRKRSQSVSSKKMPKASMDGPRMLALAPEPPEVPKRPEGLMSLSADTPDQSVHELIPNESLSAPRQDVGSDSPSLAHTETVDNIEQHVDSEIPAENDVQTFDFKFEGIPETSGGEPNSLTSTEAEPISEVPAPSVENEMTSTEQVLNRASIDSASSYGSIGFSNRTTSSRSSPPPSDEIRRKISAALDSEQSMPPLVEPPLALRPHLLDAPPDSPTDPMMHHGRLSPVPEAEAPRWPLASETRTSPRKSPALAPPDIASRREESPSRRLRRPSTPGGHKGQCRGCANLIMAGQKSVSSADGRLTGRYHKECFVCRTCKEPFATADFYVHDDHPYCSHHYHVQNNTLCGACGNGIEGQYLETFDVSGHPSRKFHAKCLSCATCKIQLTDDYFDFHGKVYCERDAFRAANGSSGSSSANGTGPRSPYDTAPSRPSPLVREYINSGEPGLKGRFPERRTTRFMITA